MAQGLNEIFAKTGCHEELKLLKHKNKNNYDDCDVVAGQSIDRACK